MPDRPAVILKSSLVLGGFALVVAVVLALVNLATADRILEQQLAAERRALAEVFPATLHDNDLLADAFTLATGTAMLELTNDRPGYLATRDGLFAGVILPVEAHDGYSGDIRLLVGILASGSVTGVRVLEHRETPGLGDKIDIDVDDWILAFNGRTLGNPPLPRWQVLRDGGEFDQLTGATVTPRAVVNAVRRALQFFEQNRALWANRDAD